MRRYSIYIHYGSFRPGYRDSVSRTSRVFYFSLRKSQRERDGDTDRCCGPFEGEEAIG